MKKETTTRRPKQEVKWGRVGKDGRGTPYGRRVETKSENTRCKVNEECPLVKVWVTKLRVNVHRRVLKGTSDIEVFL